MSSRPIFRIVSQSAPQPAPMPSALATETMSHGQSQRHISDGEWLLACRVSQVKLPTATVVNRVFDVEQSSAEPVTGI